MRIFVLTTLIFGTLIACETKHDPRQVMMDDGQSKLAESDRLEQQLKTEHVELVPLTKEQEKEQLATGFWSPLGRDERRAIKQNLLRYIVLTTQVLEMESHKGMYLTHREQVITKRNAAIEIENGCEDFEQLMGPAFDGKDAAVAAPAAQPGLKTQR